MLPDMDEIENMLFATGFDNFESQKQIESKMDTILKEHADYSLAKIT